MSGEFQLKYIYMYVYACELVYFECEVRENKSIIPEGTSTYICMYETTMIKNIADFYNRRAQVQVRFAYT